MTQAKNCSLALSSRVFFYCQIAYSPEDCIWSSVIPLSLCFMRDSRKTSSNARHIRQPILPNLKWLQCYVLLGKAYIGLAKVVKSIYPSESTHATLLHIFHTQRSHVIERLCIKRSNISDEPCMIQAWKGEVNSETLQRVGNIRNIRERLTKACIQLYFFLL